MKRLLLVLPLLLAGCTTPDETPPQPSPTTAGSTPPWTEPADYTFVAERTCDGAKSLGKYKVTVAGGAVGAAERIDGKTAEGEEEVEIPTLGGMVELARTAVDDGAEAITTYDPADGHPTSVVVNRAEEENGGATCFKITDYAPR
ncbi:DUF6174 domain-containing protein [Actinoplanes sp. NPDC049265]|uniref:DUF6174 domain-containing protein n=1 Tax=Actinoplanes sp. NPDC049265 TaxID=3363902 RepID=UPI003710E0F8